jgi:hypothetical protein
MILGLGSLVCLPLGPLALYTGWSAQALARRARVTSPTSASVGLVLGGFTTAGLACVLVSVVTTLVHGIG